MSKPIIAIDIDNVLAASAQSFIRISNRLFGDHITFADFSEDWPRMWGVGAEEAERRRQILRANQYQKDYEPIAGAHAVIEQLATAFNLKAVTSRTQQAKTLTRTWLEANYAGYFDDITFADLWANGKAADGHLRHEGDLYIQVRADYVIDDQLKHCEAAANDGLKAILFGDYPWNQANMLPVGITRRKDWRAVQEYFDGQAA